MRVGVLGSGEVAKVLAVGCSDHGHDVVIGSRDATKLEEWAAEHPRIRAGTFAEAAQHGDLLILAVRGAVATDVLRLAGEDALDGKPVIDVTNPLDDRPPDNGVIAYFTDLDSSLMERLQSSYPSVRFVKAFNSVGNQHMVHPRFEGGPPTMFICGDDEEAKGLVGDLLDRFGWEVADLGGVESARAIEPLCMLWCIPGLLHGQWDHAFKLVRAIEP